MRVSLGLLLFLLTQCVPTKGDVEDAVEDATESCREIILDSVPFLVAAAAQACSGLGERVGQAEEAVARSVLEGLGCVKGAEKWDCSGSIVCEP